MSRPKKEIIKEYQNAGVPIYKRSFFPIIVVILASCCDFVTVFSVSEYYLAENVVINIAITSAVAFILNFLPALLGSTIADNEAANRKILIVILSVAFVLLFTLTFLLRWTSRDVMFDDTSNLNLFGEAVTSSGEISSAENVLTILIGCSTLFTSILSFVFSVTAISKEQSMKNLKEIRMAELEEERDIYIVHISELENVLAENSEEQREQKAYEDAKQRIEEYRNYFKEIVRVALAEYLHDPEAVGTILQNEEPIVY